MLGNISGYKKIFLGYTYTSKKYFSPVHDTFHVAYIPKFRPSEVQTVVLSISVSEN